ncbi:MAG: lipid A phosphoethanolamine transferase, partial [Muribaculaceae bacterium]|nr:lipid A phosphoethanolamine transferase [Muribaculaceae bacterium]
MLVLLVPNALLCHTEQYTLLDCFVNIILPVGIYLGIISLSRKTGTMILWLLPFFILAAFQIVLLYLYGESIIAVDMYINVLTTNPGEATELLANLGPAIIFVIVLYIPALIWAIVLVCKHKRMISPWFGGLRVLAVLTLSSGIILAGIDYWKDPSYRPHIKTFPINVCYNIGLAIDHTATSAHHEETSCDFTYEAQSIHPTDTAEVYVLVIGETGRALNWQLGGYKRPTNPRLSVRDYVHFYSHAISESNITHKSVPLLLTSLTAENFDSLRFQKSIVTAFKEAGFHTAFISNQAPNRSYTEHFSHEADTTLYIQNTPTGHQYDSELLKYVSEILADSVTKQFIVLHSYGSHFKYQERYPEEFGKFHPDDCNSATYANREKLINAYDNTILYTDAWLDDLIELLSSTRKVSGMIYVSDHGEDIMDDDRKRFLHASPTPTFYQLNVGMLSWVSPEFTNLYQSKSEALHSNAERTVNSSASTFHTILDMAGIETPYFDRTLSLASPEYTPAHLYYL